MRPTLVLAASAALLVAAANADSAVRLVTVSSPTAAGEIARLTVVVAPARPCSASIAYGGGAARPTRLARRAPAAGRVSWSWRVPASAPPGRWPIAVDCGEAGSLRTSFVVACGRGHARVAVAGRVACRPAADLRLTGTASPGANRVGGTFVYELAVVNAGGATAARVSFAAEAQAEPLSASSEAGSCTIAGSPSRVVCDLGNLPPAARVAVAIVLRGAAVGPLGMMARASSATPESRPADNATTITARVTPPDHVRGRGIRALFGAASTRVAVEVDAISGPAGHDPEGTFATQYLTGGPEPALDVRGRVVCVAVEGNRAAVGGIVETSSNHASHPPGSGMLFGFTDNGTPGAGRDTTTTYFSARPCGELLAGGGPELPLLDGDFAVHDER